MYTLSGRKPIESIVDAAVIVTDRARSALNKEQNLSMRMMKTTLVDDANDVRYLEIHLFAYQFEYDPPGEAVTINNVIPE